jgi:cation transport ATPase
VILYDAVAGYIAVRTTAMADNSAVAKMARLVEEAQNNRSSTQRLIDTCAKYYTPGKLKFRWLVLQYLFKMCYKKIRHSEVRLYDVLNVILCRKLQLLLSWLWQ